MQHTSNIRLWLQMSATAGEQSLSMSRRKGTPIWTPRENKNVDIAVEQTMDYVEQSCQQYKGTFYAF